MTDIDPEVRAYLEVLNAHYDSGADGPIPKPPTPAVGFEVVRLIAQSIGLLCDYPRTGKIPTGPEPSDEGRLEAAALMDRVAEQ